jgi:hypothetical protein
MMDLEDDTLASSSAAAFAFVARDENRFVSEPPPTPGSVWVDWHDDTPNR